MLDATFQFLVGKAMHHSSHLTEQSLYSLYPETLYSDKGTELNQPEFCQPVCTALQVALVELLADWNVHPFAVVGHSSGEVAAAYCAGIITKSYALELAFFRGLAVSATSRIGSPDGGMLATRLSSDKCSELLAELANSQNPETRNIGIACYNKPQNLTLSGGTNRIERLALTRLYHLSSLPWDYAWGTS